MVNTNIRELLAKNGIYRHDLSQYVVGNMDQFIDAISTTSFDPLQRDVAAKLVDRDLSSAPYINDIMRDKETVAKLMATAQHRFRIVTRIVVDILIENILMLDELSVIIDDVSKDKIFNIIRSGDIIELEAVKLLLLNNIHAKMDSVLKNNTKNRHKMKKLNDFDYYDKIYLAVRDHYPNAVMVGKFLRSGNPIVALRVLKMLNSVLVDTRHTPILSNRLMSVISSLPIGVLTRGNKSTVSSECVIVTDTPSVFIHSDKKELAVYMVALSWLQLFKQEQEDRSYAEAPPLVMR